jgi:signal peptidase
VDRAAARPALRLRVVEVLLAGASVGLVGAVAACVRPTAVLPGLLLVAALTAGVAPFVLLTLCGSGRAPDAAAPPAPLEGSGEGPARTVTTVVRVGGEPIELVRACVIVAARAGPTVVVTGTRTDLPGELEPLDVPVYRAATAEQAVNAAAREISTDTVLVIDPGAVPIGPACEAAAADLHASAGWAIGTVRAFAGESYAPDCREALGSRLRASARTRGLVLWERDATLVRTELLRRHPLEPARPLGAWLRALGERGVGGRDAGVLALRFAPAGAAVFWPATVGRQRELAADLGDAVGRGAARVRILALALLVRELYAYPLGIWLLAPLIVAATGELPFRGAAGPLLGAILGLALARWLVVRRALGVPLRPLDELVAAAFDAPGSLAAASWALTRRVTPTTPRASPRLLVWTALALALASVVSLVERSGPRRGVDVVAGLALVELALLWMFLLRLFAQRRWMRNVARVPLRLPAVIDGRDARTVDVSPSGLAVAVDSGVHPVGATESVSVLIPDAPPLVTPAVVTDRRVVAGQQIVGLALRLDPAPQVQWVEQLFDQLDLDELEAHPAGRRPFAVAEHPPATTVDRALALVDGAAMAIAVVISGVTLCLLALAILGYRPLVVRSASMAPTLDVGDLIVVDEVRARDVAVGDIVTFDDRDRSGEVVTHRVVRVSDGGEDIRFETRGDANSTSERWSRPPDAVVPRLSLRVPAVGRALGWLRDRDLQLVLVGVGTMLLVANVVLAVRRAGRPRAPST